MDFLPTKGIEYLVILGYLALLVPFWMLLVKVGPRLVPVREAAQSALRRGLASSWFSVPEGYLFHRGHTWALPEGGGVLRVGMDDFVHHLLGTPQALKLPQVGTRLGEGSPGWRVQVEGQDVDLLSPVDGEVMEINQEAMSDPERTCQDPYGCGWLFKVRTDQPHRALNNLMPAGLARAWMDETTMRLSAMAGPEVGAVLQDGGVPVSGMARQLGGEEWHQLAADFLLTRDA